MADEWYNNLFGTGTNIWGAGGNGNTQKMIDAGLLAPDAKEKAQSQSLMRGLLGAGVSYLSQPQNQNYGSITPYIGKALGAGMEAAQKPFDNLATTASQNSKLNDMIAAKDKKEAIEKARANLYTTIPGRERVSWNRDERLDVTDQNGNTTQVAPNMGQVNKSLGKTPDRKILNNKALSELAVEHPEAAKEILENHKTMKEIETMGAAEGQETFRAATAEELKRFGAPHGQISNKTGKFHKTGEKGPIVSIGDTTTTIDNVGDQAKGNNANLNEFYNSLNMGGDAAQDTLQQSQRALALLKNVGTTGKGTQGLRDLDKVMVSLGYEPMNYTEEELASGEVLTGILNKLAIAQRPAASGVMTDNDFRVFQTMVGDMGQTKFANEAIQEGISLMARRKAEMAQKVRDYKRGMTSFRADGSIVAKKAGELDDGLWDLIAAEKAKTGIEMRALRDRMKNKFEGRDPELAGTGAKSTSF